MREVLLCDEKGTITGTASAEQAHKTPGILHHGYSVFVYRYRYEYGKKLKELLIQQRASHKLFGDFWANTCCSHPWRGMKIDEAAAERLFEEFGLRCKYLQFHSSFIYKADDPAGRGTEYEFDRIFTGTVEDYDFPLNPNPAEIAQHKWVNNSWISEDIKAHPEKYAPWFILAFNRILTGE